LLGIATVTLQGEGAVERGRARKARVVCDHRAGGDAQPAADALDRRIDLAPFARIAPDVAVAALQPFRPEGRIDRSHLCGEGRHVHHEIAQQREVVERAHGNGPACSERGQARSACPTLAPIDDHATGAAHPDPTGVAEGEARIPLSLDGDGRVEHGGIGAGVDRVLLPAFGVARGPPEHPERDYRSTLRYIASSKPTRSVRPTLRAGARRFPDGPMSRVRSVWR